MRLYHVVCEIFQDCQNVNLLNKSTSFCLMHQSFQFIIKTLSVLNVFKFDIVLYSSSWPFPGSGKWLYFLYLHRLYQGLCFIYSCNFWKLFSFLFSFLVNSKNNLVLLFTEIGDSIFWVLTHKSWVYHRLYICKSCWNGLLQWSISDNNSKRCRVHLTSTHLFNFLKPFDIASLSHLYIFQILLISLQMLVRLFVSNSII